MHVATTAICLGHTAFAITDAGDGARPGDAILGTWKRRVVLGAFLLVQSLAEGLGRSLPVVRAGWNDCRIAVLPWYGLGNLLTWN